MYRGYPAFFEHNATIKADLKEAALVRGVNVMPSLVFPLHVCVLFSCRPRHAIGAQTVVSRVQVVQAIDVNLVQNLTNILEEPCGTCSQVVSFLLALFVCARAVLVLMTRNDV